MEKTGLSRSQIYKWFFDMNQEKKPKEKKQHDPELQIYYPPSMLQAPSAEQLVTGNIDPIFKIIKVARVRHIDKQARM